MSGYGGADDESVNAMETVNNYIELSRRAIPTGNGTLVCLDCGDPIPPARKLAQPGSKYCVVCQEDHDKLPGLKLLTRIL